MSKVLTEIMQADALVKRKKNFKREKRTQELRRSYQKPQDKPGTV